MGRAKTVAFMDPKEIAKKKKGGKDQAYKWSPSHLNLGDYYHGQFWGSRDGRICEGGGGGIGRNSGDGIDGVLKKWIESNSETAIN
jgi:hypothetical protein